MESYSCKNCGSSLSYNPANDSLSCTHCGSSFKVDNDSFLNTKKNYTPYVTLEETSTNQYHCNACGSNLNTVKDALVKRCPNCGSTSLNITNSISYTPDGIVPFKISKEQATENFYNWIMKRKFAPKDLKKMAKLGKLSGLYTPVWNFDCQTFTKYHGVGIDEHKDHDGNVHTTRHPFGSQFSSTYNNILISANKQVSDLTIMKLGHFGLDNLKVYNPEYLCGFIGADIDFDLHTKYTQFTSFINNSERSKAERDHRHYDRIVDFHCHTDIYDPKYNYIYLPIWANYYTYKNKTYSCYINGYSGKVSGSFPKSGKKIFWLVFGILLGLGALVAIGWFIGAKLGSGFNPINRLPGGFDFDNFNLLK